MMEFICCVITGLVNKLSQHKTEFGFIDSICLFGEEYLLTSGYDMDHGYGYINGIVKISDTTF